ncbi:notch-regulated ankyrin repeat-containing protein-like [Rhinophrynus dorsalis]
MSLTEMTTCSIPHTQPGFQEAVQKGNKKELQSLLPVIDCNLELVKLLVKYGEDIRLENRDGWSALHIAAYGEHQDIVLYIIISTSQFL